MAPGVDLLQLLDRDFGVDRGRLQALMAEQLLGVADVCAALQHVRRARVPQQMARTFFSEPGQRDPRGRHARDDIGIKSFAVAR